MAKFQSLISVIDQSGGFYRIPVERRFCSHVNIPFRIAVAGEANSDLEAKFLSDAAALGLVQLKVCFLGLSQISLTLSLQSLIFPPISLLPLSFPLSHFYFSSLVL